MKALEVGQPYDPTRDDFRETTQLRMGPHFVELVRFLGSPSNEELAGAASGRASFAVLEVSPNILILAYQHGDGPWGDTPWQAHRTPPDLRGLPRVEEDGAITIRSILVDASTGILRANCHFRWPPDFAAAIYGAAARQLDAQFDDAAASRDLASVYNKYPSTLELLRGGVHAACTLDDGLNVPAEYFYGDDL